MLTLAGLIAATLVLQPAALAQVGPSWTSTGSLTVRVSNHTATLLPNGNVLVAGGFSEKFGFHEFAELYDPATGTWNLTDILNEFRSDHTATLLANGRVLVAGGATVWNLPVKSAELYDPNTARWSNTGNLIGPRYGHTATLLQNGTVLIAGGTNDPELFSFLTSAELYDPGTGTWSGSGNLNTERYHHTATLLPNGKVLVAGGYNWSFQSLSSAELYDPTTGTWTNTGSLNIDRTDHTATLLPNGKVLVAGGYNVGDKGFNTLNSAELYDPATGAWTVTGSLNSARSDHSAVLLSNGKVLVAAGQIFASWPLITLNEAELYDPTAGSWSFTANLGTARRNHTATMLLNGSVLVAGGDNQGQLNSAELYESPGIGMTVSPSSGNGFSQTFSFGFFNSNGFANILSAQLLIHSNLNAAGACYLYYHRESHAVWLQNDSGSGWIGPSVLGSGPALQNGQCTVNVASSSAFGSGNNLTLNLALAFTSAFSGSKNIYAISYDNEGLTNNWQQTGTWTVP